MGKDDEIAQPDDLSRLMKGNIKNVIKTHEELDLMKIDLEKTLKKSSAIFSKEEKEEYLNHLHTMHFFTHFGLIHMRKLFEFYQKYELKVDELRDRENPNVWYNTRDSKIFLGWLRRELNNCFDRTLLTEDVRNKWKKSDWRSFYEKAKSKDKKNYKVNLDNI